MGKEENSDRPLPSRQSCRRRKARCGMDEETVTTKTPPSPKKKELTSSLSVHYSINFTFFDGDYFLVFQQKKDEQLFQVDQILMQQAV